MHLKHLNKIKEKSCFRWRALVALIVLNSCGAPQHDNSEPVRAYFDVKGFVEKQIEILETSKPLVVKTLKMGEEENQVSIKDVDWKKELELFVQADINKPAYKQSYSIKRAEDSLSVEYVLKAGEELPVRYLKIEFNESNDVPVKISATLKSENKLYQSEKKIDMVCRQSNNLVRLADYKIAGYQKLAAMRSKPFHVEGKVTY